MLWGTQTGQVTVELHDSLDEFRLEVRRPWWVSAAVTGATIDLAPASLLAQREGVETTLRTAMAELLMSARWRAASMGPCRGSAIFCGRPADLLAEVSCPADAELTLAVSAVAQREAEARAVQCFARALAKVGDWRLVR